MAPKRKQQSRQFEQMADSISNRVGMRNRIPKQFPDYVDCSFSESEPVRLVPIPLMPQNHHTLHVAVVVDEEQIKQVLQNVADTRPLLIAVS